MQECVRQCYSGFDTAHGGAWHSASSHTRYLEIYRDPRAVVFSHCLWSGLDFVKFGNGSEQRGLAACVRQQFGEVLANAAERAEYYAMSPVLRSTTTRIAYELLLDPASAPLSYRMVARAIGIEVSDDELEQVMRATTAEAQLASGLLNQKRVKCSNERDYQIKQCGSVLSKVHTAGGGLSFEQRLDTDTLEWLRTRVEHEPAG